MGLATALNSTVGALRSQSTAIAAVSENIANVSTTAYKIRTVNFQALVGETGNGNTTGGGVITKTSQSVAQTGQISTTGISTNVAIKGQGFFVVSDNLTNKPSAFAYSRNGNFQTDKSGNLVNDEGYYLLGQVTNNQGIVTATNKNDLNSLSPINVAAIQGAASPTANVNEQINLPADAAVGANFTSSFEVFDSLGVSSTITQTWAKTASNTWTVAMSNPKLTSNLATTTGTSLNSAGNQLYTLTFSGTGSLLSKVPASNVVALTFAGTGASSGNLNLNLGTVGLTDGISQYSSNTAVPDITITSITGDGVRFGKLTSVEIADSGIVTAVFDNGLRQPVYQIPIATFPNPNGLTQINGSVYGENQEAGILNLQKPTVGNAGSIVSKALEGSNADISEEFNKLIVAQQAYSAAAQIITTVRTLSDALNQAIR